jgi:ribosomal protein S18 acetylase RimI-like enzyme
MVEHLLIRALRPTDPPAMAEAFACIGKPASLFERYLAEQAAGMRSCFVAIVFENFAGYANIHWSPAYPAFAGSGIPEIQDLKVLPSFRRQGIATALLDLAEAQIAFRSPIAGISVGLHPGYNSAQRLYVKRGYIPDGRGVTYDNRYLHEGETTILDDELLLHLTRPVRADQVGADKLKSDS